MKKKQPQEDEEEEEEEEAGELVTNILQRHLAALAVSDTSLLHLLANLETPDVVFHVRRTSSDPAAGVDETNVPRVLAHASILRRESDYFREILQRQPSLPLSCNDAQSGTLVENSSQASNCSNAEEKNLVYPIVSHDDPMYILPNYADMHADMPEQEHGQDAESPHPSIAASTMNDIVGREVLAHVQAQIRTKSDVPIGPSHQGFNDMKREQVVRDQEYHSSKSSSLSADGATSGYQTPENTCNGNSSSMSTSVTPPSRSEGFCSKARKSILLDNEERKASFSRFTRKSVRFSLEPAGIVLPASITVDIQRLCPDSIPIEAPTNNLVENNEEGLRNSVEESPPECIDKPLIKRRHTEVNVVMERGSASDMFSENKEDIYSFKYYVVKKLTWTLPVLIGIMEWLYMGVCHINLEDLPGLYDAAYRAVITSLTWCIRRHSMPNYLNLALSNPLHCKHLLALCLVADCAELSSLKGFCEAIQAVNGQPKIAILETKHLPGARARDFLAEGFFVLDGHPLCVLKSSKPNELESPRDHESADYGQTFVYSSGSPTFVKFARHLQPGPLNCTGSSIFSQQTNLSHCESPQEQAWKVVLLDNDPAGSFYAFFRYASMCSLRSLTKKGRFSMLKKTGEIWERKHVGLFKLQMITRFKVGSILVESLSNAIRQGLIIKEKRGSGSFIKGPSYCTSIVIRGDPCKVLMAARAIPYDMVGRSALKIRAPCAKTFSSLFHASHTFGVDLHSHSIVLVKPLYVLIKVLEFLTKLNFDAYEAHSTERTFIELCQPTEPF